MVVVAGLSFLAAFTLLYAGVKGVHWDSPWQLLILWFSGQSTTGIAKQP